MRDEFMYTIPTAGGAGWRLAKILTFLAMSALSCAATTIYACTSSGTLYIYVRGSGTVTQCNNCCSGGPWRVSVADVVFPTPPPPAKNFIPQFVDGAGWGTALAFTNTTASTATASLNFYQETAVGDGSTQPWNPTFLEVRSTQNLSLPGG